MLTKMTLSDLKDRLGTLTFMVVLGCFAVVGLANADDVASPLDEDVIAEGDFEWLREESAGSSAWYGMDNKPELLPDEISGSRLSSEAASSSSIAPQNLSFSLSSAGDITKTYDGTTGTTRNLDDVYELGDVYENVGVGGLVGDPQMGGVTGYNTGDVQPYSSGFVGGLVGYGDGGIGGITGYSVSDGTSSSSITPKDISLSSAGEITKTYDGTIVYGDEYRYENGFVGGLVGSVGEDLKIDGISGYNTGTITGYDNVGGLVGLYDGNENHVNSMEIESDANNTLHWKTFDVADDALVNFDNSKGTVSSNGVEEGTMELGYRREGPTASVAQFGVAASGRSLFITGAKIGSRFVLLNSLGRVVASACIASVDFVVVAPRAGTYFVRVGSESRRIVVK